MHFSSGVLILVRVTIIIRTRQKCSIKAIFVAFAVALRKPGCHLKTTNLIFTPSIFDALQFIECRFGLNRGKNAVNPFGLTSILTKSKGKSTAINRGSDYFRYPNQATRREVAFRRVFLCNYAGFSCISTKNIGVKIRAFCHFNKLFLFCGGTREKIDFLRKWD